MKDNTLLYLGVGVGLLWLISRNTPAAQAQQQLALQSAAALQAQNISAQANAQNINTAANLVENLAGDFTGG